MARQANEVSGTRSRLTQVASTGTVSKALFIFNHFSLIWSHSILTSLVYTLLMRSSSSLAHYVGTS